MVKDLLLNVVRFFGLAFWIEIVTDKPNCTYYFGPFLSRGEAQMAEGGYVEDLREEGVQQLEVTVKRCKPQELTIFNEPEDLEWVKQPLRMIYQ